MPKIKICGITTLKDALAAAEAGVDLLGFNFYPKSPRSIEPESCQKITEVLRQDLPNLTLVGVFVNSSVSEIRSVLETCHLHLAQLHGDEPPEMLTEMRDIAFKAVRLSPELSLETSVSPFCRRPSVPESVSPLHPLLLVDAAVKGVYGGSGVTADWSTAAQLAQQIPLLLAGGLTPENVSQAIRQVQPWGVDVASGVEARPGVKDAARMRDFVAAARNAE